MGVAGVNSISYRVPTPVGRSVTSHPEDFRHCPAI